MFLALNVTVYCRWPWALDDNTNHTRPSGLATFTSAAAAGRTTRDRQKRASGIKIRFFIFVLLEIGWEFSRIFDLVHHPASRMGGPSRPGPFQRTGTSRMAQPPPGASFNFKTVWPFTRRFPTTESVGWAAALGPSA